MDIFAARRGYQQYVEQAAMAGQPPAPFEVWVRMTLGRQPEAAPVPQGPPGGMPPGQPGTMPAAPQGRPQAPAPGMSQQQFGRAGAVDPRMQNMDQLQRLLQQRQRRGLLD